MMNNRNSDAEKVSSILARKIFRDRRPEIKQCKFHLESLTLMIKNENGRDLYEIDLERCETSAEVLDWIFQVFGKAWSTPQMIYDFLDCLNETCQMELGNSVQGLYCPFGANHKVDWKKFKMSRLRRPWRG